MVENGLDAKIMIPLPGGETAVYNGSGLNYIRHTDWLGSSRLATTWAHAVYSKEAYAPFGETYNEAGTPDRSFTGQDQDVVTGSGGTGTYDFLFRKFDPAAGRWLSPDPAGWAVVSQADPQSFNRYAYVENQPTQAVDFAGLQVSGDGDPLYGDGGWGGFYDINGNLGETINDDNYTYTATMYGWVAENGSLLDSGAANEVGLPPIVDFFSLGLFSVGGGAPSNDPVGLGLHRATYKATPVGNTCQFTLACPAGTTAVCGTSSYSSPTPCEGPYLNLLFIGVTNRSGKQCYGISPNVWSATQGTCD